MGVSPGGALEEYRRVIAEETDVLRAGQLSRIEQAIVALWPRVQGGDHQAFHALVRLLERQAKLAGLDFEAPQELEGRMVIDLRLPGQREEVVIEGQAAEAAPRQIAPHGEE